LIVGFSFKKQLKSFVLLKNNVIWTKTNGIFVKSLGLVKSQKKNEKISTINVNELFKFLKTFILKNKINILFFLKNISSKTIKLLNQIKKKIDQNNCLIIKPSTPFTLNKNKRIKSIKRKLTKKYIKIKYN
jgi:hypothetical protein